MMRSSRPLVLDLDADGGDSPDEPVRMTLHVRNTGATPISLGLTGHPVAFDLVVSRADGTEVWRRLHGSVAPLVLRLVRLEAGQGLEFSDIWNRKDNWGRRTPPGSYIARGVLPTEDGLLTSPPRTLTLR